MPACPHRSSCALRLGTFAAMPSLADVYDRLYCRAAWSACARCAVMARLGEQRVPRNLFPDEGGRAAQILRLG